MRVLCAILAGMIANRSFELMGISLFSLKGIIYGLVLAALYVAFVSTVFE